MNTAHGIRRTGLAHFEGRHLSEAPNARTFRELDEQINAEARKAASELEAAYRRSDMAVLASQSPQSEAHRLHKTLVAQNHRLEKLGYVNG
jgi:hypothetical protein